MCKWQPVPHPLPGDLKSIHRHRLTEHLRGLYIPPPAPSAHVPREEQLHCHWGPSARLDPALLAPCRHAERPHQWGFSILSACGEGLGSPQPSPDLMWVVPRRCSPRTHSAPCRTWRHNLLLRGYSWIQHVLFTLC